MLHRSSRSRYRRASQRAPSGCAVILMVAAASCALLVLNGFIIAGFFASLGDELPEALRSPKVMQTIVFIAPVLLLVLEWRLTQALLHYVDEMWHQKSDPRQER